MEKTRDKPREAKVRNAFLARACGVVTILCVFLPAAFWWGGVLEGEAITFIIRHTDDRTLLQKVFDPNTYDFGTYQARELSYLFDYLDANVHLLLARHFDVTLFIPLSAIISSLLIIVVFRRGVRQTLPGIDRLTSELLLLLFLTCFVFVSTMGIFYRSGKPLMAPILLALMFHGVRSAQSRGGESPLKKRWSIVNRQSLVTFGLLVVAGLLDRQGFAYILIACAVFCVHYLLTRTLQDMLIASIAAAIFAHAYNLFLGPALIWAVNGYHPNFIYQHIPSEEFVGLPVLGAPRLLIANMAALTGGYYVVGYLVVSGIAAWLLWKAIDFHRAPPPGNLRERYSSGEALAMIHALIVFVLQIVMFLLMFARHGYLYEWIDHWYWYYTLPFLMTALFGLALLLNDVMPRLGATQRRTLQVALLLMAISNLLHLPANRRLMLTSHWFSQEYPQSEMLKASIRNHSRDPNLDDEYTRFFLFHERQRNR